MFGDEQEQGVYAVWRGADHINGRSCVFQAKIRIQDTLVVLVLQFAALGGAVLGFVLLENQPHDPFVDAKITAQQVSGEVLVHQLFKEGRAGIPLAVNFGKQAGHNLASQ